MSDTTAPADTAREIIVQTAMATPTADVRAAVVSLLSISPLGEAKVNATSGSVGRFAGGKVEVDGVRYQVSLNVTAIGTKR